MRMFKKSCHHLIFLILIACLCQCTEPEKEILPEDTEFTAGIGSDTTIILMPDSTYTIKILPVSAKTDISVTTDVSYYKIPANRVITISDAGEIKAVEEGKAFVTISNNTRKLKFTVVVVKLPEKIPLNYTGMTIRTGKNLRIIPGYYNQYETSCFGGFRWEALDKTIVYADDFGTVTALKEGNTKVKVSFKKFPEVSAECAVQVLDHIVYLAGVRMTVSSSAETVSWRNNSEPVVYNNSLSIYGMDYHNDSLFLAGHAIMIQSDDINRAFLMKNRVEPIIFPQKGAIANDITHLGNDIYTCGSYLDNSLRTVAVWKNSLLVPISDTSLLKTESRGRCITTSGSNIYVGGYHKNNQDKQVACYWKNKERVDLSDGLNDAFVYSICVADQDVYAAGYYLNSSHQNIACYWKNGIRVDLQDSYSQANSIAVSNNNVYVAGTFGSFNSSLACCWRNGVRSDLTMGQGAIKGNAVAIKVVDGVEYIAGYYELSSSPYWTIGCYWKDGVRYDIPASGYSTNNSPSYPYSYVDCMAIE